MVESDPPLLEPLAAEPLIRRANSDARTAADAIEDLGRVEDHLHVEPGEQLGVERPAGCEVTHGELDMRDAIHLHAIPPTSISPPARAGVFSVHGPESDILHSTTRTTPMARHRRRFVDRDRAAGRGRWTRAPGEQRYRGTGPRAGSSILRDRFAHAAGGPCPFAQGHDRQASGGAARRLRGAVSVGSHRRITPYRPRVDIRRAPALTGGTARDCGPAADRSVLRLLPMGRLPQCAPGAGRRA